MPVEMVTVGVTAASLVGGELLPQLRGRLDVSRIGNHGMFAQDRRCEATTCPSQVTTTSFG